MKSTLILVDGISGSGKDTQVPVIEAFMRDHGYTVRTVKEPSDFLRDVSLAYKNRPVRDGLVETLLYTADRRQHFLEVVAPLLAAEGNCVISNRSFISTAAYQSLQGVPLDEILRLNVFYPQPDLALVFLCDPAEAVRRIQGREAGGGMKQSRDENLERIAAIRANYASLESRIPNLRIVHSDGHPHAVPYQLRSHLNKLVGTPMEKAVFLDKDGTLVDNSRYPDVIPTDEIYVDKTVRGLRALRDAGYRLFIISSQPWVARGRMTAGEVEDVFKNVVKKYLAHGVRIDGYGFCPHARSEGCRCKKPDTLLLERIADQYTIDTSASYFVGDMADDIRTGRNFGLQPVMVATGNAPLEERTVDISKLEFSDVNAFAEYVLKR